MVRDMEVANYDTVNRKEHGEMAPGSEHRGTAHGHYKESALALIEW